MRELLFADDSALVAHCADETHKVVAVFSDHSKKFGLKTNIKKTEVQVMDTLTMKYRAGGPRLVHLSGDYVRDSGTTTINPRG